MPPPFRICLTAPPFYEVPPKAYGGIERICYELVEGLITRGHEVTLIAAGQNHTRARFFATFPEAQLEGSESDAEIEIIHAARAAAILRDLDFDIVHDHTRAGPLTAPARRQPTVVTVHCALVGPDSHSDLVAAYGESVQLVAISEAQRRSSPDMPWFATAYNGIDLAEFPYSEKKGDFLVYLGRVSPHKGVSLAIAAAEATGRELVIAGSWTIPSEADYFNVVVRPRLGAGVTWLGEVEATEAKKLLAGAACLVYPVLWEEPFGLAIIEAMACGTPVVGLRRGSLPELIVDGTTGVICEDEAELPSAIERASRMSPLACRENVARHFSSSNMVAKYEGIYQMLLA